MTGRKGFTLIELLVAVSLMVIITGSIVYIFGTGQKIFSDSDRQIQIYQSIRHLSDSIEREIPLVVKTHSMEFFKDESKPTNGQFEPGIDSMKPGQCFFTDLRQAVGGADSEYIASMCIHADQYEDPITGMYSNCDAIYFRTTVMVGDKQRDALVCYTLETDAAENAPPIQGDYPYRLKYVTEKGSDGKPLYPPVLKRYVIYQDPQNPDGPLNYIQSDLCAYVLDFQISYFYHNTEEATETAHFVRPENAVTKEFCYRGEGTVTLAADGRVQMTLDKLTSGAENPSDMFSQIAPGDTIFLYFDGTPPGDVWTDRDNKVYTIESLDRGKGIIYFRSGEAPPASTGSTAPVKFRAGYLPAAVKMSFRICDENRTIIRHVTRCFKIKSM